MLEAKTPKSKKPVAARRAKVSRPAKAAFARKAGSPRPAGRTAVEGVIIAAINRDLPATLFLVALADDEAFEEIRRRSVLLFLGRDDLADVTRSLGITIPAEKIKGAAVTLVNAVALSRRLRTCA